MIRAHKDHNVCHFEPRTRLLATVCAARAPRTITNTQSVYLLPTRTTKVRAPSVAHWRARLAPGNNFLFDRSPTSRIRCVNRTEPALASSRGVSTGLSRSDDAARSALRTAHQDLSHARLLARRRQGVGSRSASTFFRVPTVHQGKECRLPATPNRHQSFDQLLPSHALESILVREHL